MNRLSWTYRQLHWLAVHGTEAARRTRRLIDRAFSLWSSVQLKACGGNFSITTEAVIGAPDRITIGDNFLGVGQLSLLANDGEIVIGHNVGVNRNVQINAAQGRIVMGNDILIAANVVLRASNHRTDGARLIREQSHIPGEIIVEDDVWIGSNAVVTGGVTLARGTVVGAGAVVTRSTEPYSIVAGVPARPIGKR